MRAPKGRVEEEITPRGDGNDEWDRWQRCQCCVEEEITPRGDGNGRKRTRVPNLCKRS